VVSMLCGMKLFCICMAGWYKTPVDAMFSKKQHCKMAKAGAVVTVGLALAQLHICLAGQCKTSSWLSQFCCHGAERWCVCDGCCCCCCFLLLLLLLQGLEQLQDWMAEHSEHVSGIASVKWLKYGRFVVEVSALRDGCPSWHT
jgi:hypothetical protein